MAFGAQVFNASARQWVDIVQPNWIIDQRTDLSGSGVLSYNIDTNSFTIVPLSMKYTTTHKNKNPPTFSVVIVSSSQCDLHYNLPETCTFLVTMEAR